MLPKKVSSTLPVSRIQAPNLMPDSTPSASVPAWPAVRPRSGRSRPIRRRGGADDRWRGTDNGGVNEGDTLLWQLGVASSLFDLVIAGLSDEEAFRAPAMGAWTLHLGENGVWRSDWAD